MATHMSVTEKFSIYLTTELRKCFITTHKTNCLKQSKMWGEYHKLRTSEKFQQEWKEFLEVSTGVQHVTHEMFKNLIKLDRPISNEVVDTVNMPIPMSYGEKNALRYVAGYVCRKLHDHLHMSSHTISGRDEMIVSLTDMRGSDKCGDGEEWLNLINRGGLWHVNDDVFDLL